MNWQTPQELPDLRRVGIVALDTETRDKGLRDKRGSSWPWRDGHICGISIAYRADGDVRAHYFPLRHPDTDNFDSTQLVGWLKDLITSGVRIVTHNGIYDWGWLRADGGIVTPPADQLAAPVGEAVALLRSMVSVHTEAEAASAPRRRWLPQRRVA